MTDGQLDLGIEREGESYRTYNYATKQMSKDLTKDELNGFLRDYDQRREEYAAAERERIESEQKRKNEIAEIDNLARNSVKEYKTLSAPSQSMIRRIFREGRSQGISDSDLAMYARVSAHSGIDIQFDKEATYRGAKEDGTADYADGFYEASKNRIVVNPEGKRTAERLLIHELDHAIRKGDNAEFRIQNAEFEATKKKIDEEYGESKRNAEYFAFYSEEMLTNKHSLEKLLEAEPTLKDKILSFFKGASTDYADVPKLAGAAKKYYRTYKKLFDEFSARNAESNANENTITSMNQKNMQVSDRQYAAEEQRRFVEYNKPITKADVDVIHNIAAKTPEISVNKFTKQDIETTQKWAYKFHQELGKKSPFFRAWYGEWRAHERSNYVDVQAMERRDGKNPRGSYKNNDTGWIINSSSVGYDETNSHSGKDKKSIIAMQNIDKIIENSILFDTEISNPGRGKKSIYTAFMHKFYAPISIDGKAYIAKMSVDESYMPGQNDTNKKFYHVRAIKIETAPSVGIGESHTPIMESTVSKYSIADLYEFVKGYDQEFTTAPEISPLLLNEDGTPKVFYHGTNAEFNTFEKGHKRTRGRLNFGEGFYFAANKKYAENYIDDGKVIEAYVSLKKPYSVIGNQFTEFEMDDIRSKLPAEDRTKLNYDNVNEYLAKLGYDGVIGFNYSGTTKTINTVLAFEPTQIKSATDNIGTFSKYEGDIRYALDIDSERENISGAEVKPKAKAEPKAKAQPKAKTKAQVRADQVVQNKKIRAEADYTTDKVFSQASVKRNFDKVEAVKKIPASVREDIARRLWIELEMSEGDEIRDSIALGYSIELFQAIRFADFERIRIKVQKPLDRLQKRCYNHHINAMSRNQ